jgi:PAS domain S-box-containing protein
MWAAGLSLMLGLGLSWLLEDTGSYAVAASVMVAVGLLLALSLKFSRQSELTVYNIADALNHVSSDAGGKRPPTPTSAEAKRLVGQIYKLASSSRDLTTTIETDRERLRSMLELLPVGVWVFDREQKLLYANSAAHQLLGTKDHELKGAPRPKVLDWLFQTDQTFDVWLKQAQDNKVRDFKFWERVSLITHDNQRLIGDVAVNYEKGDSHDIETVIVFVNRTSEYMGDEAQLDFVAVAAHELRGPITVIRGYLDVFKQELKEVFTVDQRALLQKGARF